MTDHPELIKRCRAGFGKILYRYAVNDLRVNSQSLAVKSSCLKFSVEGYLAQGDFNMSGYFHFRCCQLRLTHKKAQTAKTRYWYPISSDFSTHCIPWNHTSSMMPVLSLSCPPTNLWFTQRSQADQCACHPAHTPAGTPWNEIDPRLVNMAQRKMINMSFQVNISSSLRAYRPGKMQYER